MVIANIEHTLDTPSDHHTLQITLPSSEGAQYGTPGWYRMDTMDADLFGRTLLGLTPAQPRHLQMPNHPTLTPDAKTC